ncbi:MAG: MerR family transcriptional regulator [Pseudomonadota bacterium]
MSADGSAKGEEAFRTISEAAGELDVPQHVLRFWEQKFGAIRPMKRAGGRRYYRPQDIDLLHGVKSLLYKDGFTIKGAQQVLKERGVKFVQELGRAARDGAAPSALEIAEEHAAEHAVDQVAETAASPALQAAVEETPAAPTALDPEARARLAAARARLTSAQTAVDEALARLRGLDEA